MTRHFRTHSTLLSPPSLLFLKTDLTNLLQGESERVRAGAGGGAEGGRSRLPAPDAGFDPGSLGS